MEMSVKKLVVSAILVASVVSLSSFAVPIGASKYFPIQYLANVVAGVFLGPGHGVTTAFCISLVRSLMGMESLLAFPGSMIGAPIYGLTYRYSGKPMLAYAGEVFGTDIVDGILCYPVATMVMGKEVATFAYVMPSLTSMLCGIVIAAFLIGVLCKSGILKYVKHLPDTDIQSSKTVGK